MSKRILIISQYHTPEIGAAATRWRDYAAILSQHGFEVTVLSEIPNYPTGAVYGSYKYFKAVRENNRDYGYEIVRVPVWVNPRITTIQRLGFYFSFVLSALLNLRKLPGYDHVIVTSPPLTVGIIGYAIRKFMKGSMILDVRDLWPESAVILGELKPGSLRKAAYLLEKKLYDNSDCLLIAIPGFKNYLEDHTRGKKIISLPNGVSSRFLKKADQCFDYPYKKFKVLFSGNIGLAQDLENVINAAEFIKDKNIDFVIIGDGARREEIQQFASLKNLKNVRFIDPVDQNTLIKEIKTSSVCLVPLMKSNLFKNAIPSKMIEYMACSRPVIATIVGETEELLHISGGGMITEPGNSTDLANAILHYYYNPADIEIHGKNGRLFVEKFWVKERLAERLIELLEN